MNPALDLLYRFATIGFCIYFARKAWYGYLERKILFVSDDWLDVRHTREKGFASCWFDDEYIRASQVAAVVKSKVSNPRTRLRMTSSSAS